MTFFLTLLLSACDVGTITNYVDDSKIGVDGGNTTNPESPKIPLGEEDPKPAEDPKPEEPAVEDPKPEEPQETRNPAFAGNDATGIQVTKISLYQSVEITLFKNGAAVETRNAPIIGDKSALIGVFIALEEEWTDREVVGIFTIRNLNGEIQEFSDTRSFLKDTGNTPKDSGFSIEVPAQALTPQSTFSFEIKDKPGVSQQVGSITKKIPAQDLQVLDTTAVLHLKLVPIQYNADGSGRLPPTDEASINAFRVAFKDMFPVSEVTITVREPIAYDSAVIANDAPDTNTWGPVLQKLGQVRREDNAPSNTYYYGMFAPTDSFSQFCRGSCQTGVGYVPFQGNSAAQVSLGLSFQGNLLLTTALHEVGHNLGLNHTPCGTGGGSEPDYPEANGKTGVVGYSHSSQRFITANATDIMGYCGNKWVSDFTYQRMFDRISYVNQRSSRNFSSSVLSNTLYRVGLVQNDGSIVWTGQVEVNETQYGIPVVVERFDKQGNRLEDVQALFSAFDHNGGGSLMLPEPENTLVTEEWSVVDRVVFD